MSTMEQRERYEALYHATTQYLLLRDFQNAEDAVLTLLNSRPRDVDADGLEQKLVRCTESFEERLQRWTRSSEDMIKAYKLYAFVLTSKHTERLEVTGSGSGVAAGKENLEDVFEGVIVTYKKESDILDRPAKTAKPPSGSGSQVIHLHPSILQTILLSLLKLNFTYPIPYSESLPSSQRSGHPLHIARTFVERWLAGLEEDTIKTLSFPKKFIGRCKSRTSTDILSRSSSSEAPSTSSSSSSATNDNENENNNDNDEWAWYAISERLGGMNKSYRSVLRTYVLDILPRFGDWELSREMILAGLFPKAEEQEKLLKKLHTLEIQHKQLQDLSRSATISAPNSSSLSSSVSSSGFGPEYEPGTSDMDRGAGPSMSMSTSRSITTIRPGTGQGLTSIPAVERPASPSAASVLTDRTVRAVDYMKGRQRQAENREVYGSGSGRQEERRDDRRSPRAETGQDEKEPDQGRKGSETERSAGSKRGDEDSVVGSTRSLTQGSARFGHAAFETLRARIVRYLDTPIDQDHDHDNHQGNDDGSRPRARRSLSVSSRRSKELARLPLHQRLSRNFTFRLIVRLLSAISIVAFVWGLIRRRRQIRRKRAIAQGGMVGDPIMEGSFVQEVQDAVKIVRDKVVAVFKMGTTISYV